MAYAANWLQSSALSHATFTTTNHRRDTISASFRPPNSSDRRFIFSSNYQYKPPPAMTVQAQPKRGGLLLQKNQEEEEVASPADMQFEAPLKIVMYPDPILRAKNKRVVTFDENLKKLVDEMFDVMYKTDGIGLSAPQVGVNVQLMVFNPAGERGEGEEIVLVNPRLVKSSKKLAPFTEGCLSFPGINADVVRPEAVKVDAQDITGAKFSVSLSRLPSRVFQHEFDHLEGILFFDRMTAEVVDSIRAELLALEQKYEDRTGLVRPESVETRKRWRAAAGFGKS
ncbi:peptide deformylase 1B, chloroplastic/mitochondrial-like [Bidens hawaiensis]|uniref:peptide deformylase 1B, chloroplastic/mitochondrial-like n=1 Tax=Bidens hawaiensis TaxID=980011 RepID=UPI00404B0DDD